MANGINTICSDFQFSLETAMQYNDVTNKVECHDGNGPVLLMLLTKTKKNLKIVLGN